VICISRVICPCFGIVHRNLRYCFSIIKIYHTFNKCIEFQVNSFDSYWENFNYTNKISLISMYYVQTRADNSGYTYHRVICLVVIGSSFDSEQVTYVIWNILVLNIKGKINKIAIIKNNCLVP
jgi:hypothetical protein